MVSTITQQSSPSTAGRSHFAKASPSGSDTLTDLDLQRLVDAAGPSELVVPAGTYLMADSLRLRSGVHLRAGGEVILKQSPIVSSLLIDIVGYGHSEFRVAEPELFRPGMGVKVAAENRGGFGVTVARIVDQIGNTFFTDTPFAWDHRPDEKARATNVFPIIAGYGVEHVTVEGFVIEGVDGQRRLIDGCRAGGIFLIGCHDVRITKTEIRGYTGDAISFQQCYDIYVDACHLHHNAGHGLHPGSGTVRYVMAGNTVHDNGDCGIYYCLRTTHSICRDNEIYNNATFGISVGERDTDHLLTGNRFHGNRKPALGFRRAVIESGDRVIVRSNTFAAAPGAEPIPDVDIGSKLRDIYILDNQFSATSGPAIRVAEGCQGIAVAGNRGDAGVLPASQIESASEISDQFPSSFPNVGPQSLPSTGAKHLRVPALPVWTDRTV